jgi:hypothetical protein
MQAYDNWCPRRFGGHVTDTKRTEQGMECSGAFAKLQRATKRFVTSVCLPVSVRLSVHSHCTRLPLDGFHEIWYLIMFRRICRESSTVIKTRKKKYLVLCTKTNVHSLYLAQFFLEWVTFWTKVVEKTTKHIFVQQFYSMKIVPFMRYCGKIW